MKCKMLSGNFVSREKDYYTKVEKDENMKKISHTMVFSSQISYMTT